MPTIKKQKEIPRQVLDSMLAENDKRMEVLMFKYNPVTGEKAPGLRAEMTLTDFLGGRTTYIPVEMFSERFIRVLYNCGSFATYIERYLDDDNLSSDYDSKKETVLRTYIRLRCKYDFYFFAGVYGTIKNKDGGPDITLVLRPAQISIIRPCEEKRKALEPIRIILLKSRQFGGSTVIDIYMGWIQLFWKTNWNSNIVGHQSTSATNVFAMYERLITHIPEWLFFDIAEDYPENIKLFEGKGTTQNIKRMVPRSCDIQTGSARNPESARSTDVSMAHITEEAFFPDTEQWHVKDIVRSVISSVSDSAFTFIARESTPNGKNEFYDAWQAAKEHKSSYIPIYVPWFAIEKYTKPFKTEQEKTLFAAALWKNRTDKKGNGAYFWWLWTKGATLEGIQWYIAKLGDMTSLDDMQQEYSSDDIEAFRNSGNLVFDSYKVDELEADCDNPIFIGDITGDSTLPDISYDPDTMMPLPPQCMQNLSLIEAKNGEFHIWDYPDTEEKVYNRYLVAVDIGGAHKTSDYHDIVVLDRYDLMFGGVECVVAEWHGHCEPDQLAMRCAQIAKFYNDAYLVVENNTAYSKMNRTEGDVSQLFFPILVPLYDNLYSGSKSKTLKHRQQDEHYGFNTNRSTKPALIKHYVKRVQQHAYIEREREALNEMGHFLFYPDKNGTYGAAPDHHDDRIMARAIALYVSKFEMDAPYIAKETTPEDIRQEIKRKITEHSPTEVGRL